MLDAEKIRALREAAGLSLRATAACVWDEHGVSISHEQIRRVEEGLALDLLSSQASALASVLGVGLSDIQKPEPARVA